MEDQMNLTKEEFIEQYCRSCGSQRCEGVDSEWFDACRKAKDTYDELCKLTGKEWGAVSKYLDIKTTPVNAFKYDNDTVTQGRICITNEKNLPTCVDVYTTNYGEPDCAKRYVPELMCEDAMSYCDMVFECSVCGNMDTDGKPKYCSECGAKVKQ